MRKPRTRLLTAIVPNPDMEFHHEVCGATPEELVARVREVIERECYGASDVGSRFDVLERGERVGYATYNGRFVAAEDERPTVHGGDAVILNETY